MSGDAHVRFRERLGVRFPRATRLVVGFEHEADARRFWDDMRKRFEDVSEGSLSRSSTSFGMHGGRKAHPRTHRIDGAIGIAAEVIANL